MKRRFKPRKPTGRGRELANPEIRFRKDEALSADAGIFLSRRNASLGQLVEKLLDGSFERSRLSDPSYPA